MPYHAITGTHPSPRERKAAFSADLRAPALQHLWDHRVQGQALAPAAMLLEMAVCAGRLLTGAQLF